MVDSLALGLPPVALAAGAQTAGAVAVALSAATVLAARTPRVRALAALATLVLTPALLIGQVYDTSQFASARAHPALAVLAGALAVLALALAAVVLRRRPWVVPVAAVLCLPFRIPIAAGGETFNLLVPLYLVVGAGTLAAVWPVLAAMRRGDPAVGDEDPRDRARPLALALAGAVALYGLQTLYSADATKAADNLAFFYAPFVLLFALLRAVRWERSTIVACFLALLALALAFAGIGFVEYHTRTLLLNPKVIDSNAFASYFRVNSLFFDPNIYGRFLALVMLAVATVLVWTRRPARAVAALVALAVLWGGLVLTFSQSSFVALLVGLAVLAALRWSVRWTLAGVALALLVAGGVALGGGKTVHISLSSSKNVDTATSGRFSLITSGLDLWKAEPLLGHGSGSFSTVYKRDRRASSERAVSASHTIPITVAAEQGVVGFVVYLAVLGSAFALLFRGAHGDPRRVALAAMFAALVVHTLAYAAFLEDPVTWAILGAGAALAVGSGGAEDDEPSAVDGPEGSVPVAA